MATTKSRRHKTALPAKAYKGSFVISFRVSKPTLAKAAQFTDKDCSVHEFAREVFCSFLDPARA